MVQSIGTERLFDLNQFCSAPSYGDNEQCRLGFEQVVGIGVN